MTKTSEYQRAVLVSLNISAWTARKYDRKVSQEVADAHGATIDAGRYNKHLLPADAQTYKALNSHISSLRDIHYQNTLPWSDEGWRLLTIKNYHRYTDLMRDGRHKFDTLLDEFVADYPSLRIAARNRFNGLFDDNDYPSDVRRRYGFENSIKPVPTGGDFRVALSEDEIRILTEKLEAQNKAAFAEAQSDAVKRLFKVVANIHERLAQPEAIFRDSLISNARELCEVLSGLNLEDDPKLEKYRRDTELLAGATEAQTLREDTKVRINTANRAQEILDAMKATYGNSLFA